MLSHASYIRRFSYSDLVEHFTFSSFWTGGSGKNMMCGGLLTASYVDDADGVDGNNNFSSDNHVDDSEGNNGIGGGDGDNEIDSDDDNDVMLVNLWARSRQC